MQALIPFVVALSLVSGSKLNLVPYAYLGGHPLYQGALDPYGYPLLTKEALTDYVDPIYVIADNKGLGAITSDLIAEHPLSLEPSYILAKRSVKGEENPEKSSRRKRSVPEAPTEKNLREEKSDLSSADGTLLKVLSPEVPLATSHQSQVQVHHSARIQLPEAASAIKPVAVNRLAPLLSVPAALTDISVLPSLHSIQENHIELQKKLALEASNLQNVLKLGGEPLTLVQPPTPLPILIAKESLPAAQLDLTTSISSHGVDQVHGPSPIAKASLLVPIDKQELDSLKKTESTLPKEATLISSDANLAEAKKEAEKQLGLGNLLTRTATITSHGISQIHGTPQLANIVTPWITRGQPIYPLPLYIA